ncbi:hypothetical protein HNR73_001057 [Phytomonospora endophytica]|uniref:Uncharacterized protein n=1 Tax=Phytomonospora endophytica TaxID=714109 RepID=A0A841FMN3_9ACTN|nr:hypothetical protein [Phytomonospora endophytica]GIG65437.1 hypothetical protein Pen01_17320 [Phytomonospora endophytica]
MFSASKTSPWPVARVVSAIVLTSLTINGSRAWEYSKNFVISAISWFGKWWIGITPTSAEAR